MRHQIDIIFDLSFDVFFYSRLFFVTSILNVIHIYTLSILTEFDVKKIPFCCRGTDMMKHLCTSSVALVENTYFMRRYRKKSFIFYKILRIIPLSIVHWIKTSTFKHLRLIIYSFNFRMVTCRMNHIYKPCYFYFVV